MSITWTTEQIMGLSPDNYTAKIGRNLALAEKWLLTQTDPQQSAIWAIYRNASAKSIQTTILPRELQFACSCGNRKSPCNHVLALLLLWAEQPETFSPTEPPAWVQSWLDDQPKGLSSPAQSVPISDAARATYEDRRLQNTRRGLKELQLWLHDMVRGGFATLDSKPKNYWDLMANRLVDAQAGPLGRELKSIAQLFHLATAGKISQPAASPHALATEWPQKLLSKLGRIHFLIQGFERFNTLPAQTQADLQAAVGWLPHIDSADPYSELVSDRWLVIGKRVVDEGRQKTQRTWLWGHHTNRPAQVIHHLYKPQTIDVSLIVGAEVEAELLFAPGQTPLRAEIQGRQQTRQVAQFVPGYASIAHATSAFTQALTANPWLAHFPMALRAVAVHRQKQRWFLRDAAGDLLPLPVGFEHGWHLSALSHTTPLALFGEWDGEQFVPLTLWQDARLIELSVLKGVK